jgi:beta-aspartyl-peptidase (threonine type)
VAAVKNVKNPITLARLVMEKTPHCLLVGDGARNFADECGIERTPTEQLVTDEARAEYAQYCSEYGRAVSALFNKPHAGAAESNAGRDSHTADEATANEDAANTAPQPAPHRPVHAETTLSHDTVGAVAYDAAGQVACATSTGGITGKRVGRVGDSPLLGLGGYADSWAGACSVTGHGESIMRTMLASRVVSNMEDGQDPSAAARAALTHMYTRVEGRGGAICVDTQGRIGHFGTTEAMAWAEATGTLPPGPQASGSAPVVRSGVENGDGYASVP